MNLSNTFYFIVILSVCGCATTLSKQGKNVRVSDGALGFDCTVVGTVHGSDSVGLTSAQDRESSLNQLRNSTALLGGNLVRVTAQHQSGWKYGQGRETQLAGIAYKCNEANMNLVQKCESKNAEACAEYAKVAYEAHQNQIAYSFIQQSCKMGLAKSCTFLEAFEKEGKLALDKCEKMQGAGCYDYAYYKGDSGDEASARIYFKRGCRQGHQLSCDTLDRWELLELQAANKRAEERQDKLVQGQLQAVQSQSDLVNGQLQHMRNQDLNQSLQNFLNTFNGR